jgi:hypothetical protein
MLPRLLACEVAIPFAYVREVTLNEKKKKRTFTRVVCVPRARVRLPSPPSSLIHPMPLHLLYSNFPSSRSLWVSQAPGLSPSSAAIFPTRESAPLPSRKALLDTMYMACWHLLSMTLVRRLLAKNPSALERTTEIMITWSSFPDSACQL